MNSRAIKTAIKRVLESAAVKSNRILDRAGCRFYSHARLPLGVDVARDIKKLRRGSALDVVFDVGANFGQTMRYFAAEFPSARIFCFEPVGATFAKLQAAAARFEGVRVFRHGFGEAAGEFDIFLHGNAGENSLVRPADVSVKKETVSIRTVDGFCEEQGIARINLLKIDVEGFEMPVLKGAARMLDEGRVDLVFTEVSFDAGDLGHTFFGPLHSFLQAKNFALFAFYDPRHWRNPYVCEYANALYINLGMKQGSLPQSLIP